MSRTWPRGIYPPLLWRFLGAGFKHGTCFALLDVAPLVFHPRAEEVQAYESLEVVVRTRPLRRDEAAAVVRPAAL